MLVFVVYSIVKHFETCSKLHKTPKDPTTLLPLKSKDIFENKEQTAVIEALVQRYMKRPPVDLTRVKQHASAMIMGPVP